MTPETAPPRPTKPPYPPIKMVRIPSGGSLSIEPFLYLAIFYLLLRLGWL